MMGAPPPPVARYVVPLAYCRSNPRLRSQLVHRSSLLKADTYARSAPFMRGNVLDQRTHGCRLPLASSSAARKSP